MIEMDGRIWFAVRLWFKESSVHGYANFDQHSASGAIGFIPFILSSSHTMVSEPGEAGLWQVLLADHDVVFVATGRSWPCDDWRRGHRALLPGLKSGPPFFPGSMDPYGLNIFKHHHPKGLVLVCLGGL